MALDEKPAGDTKDAAPAADAAEKDAAPAQAKDAGTANEGDAKAKGGEAKPAGDGAAKDPVDPDADGAADPVDDKGDGADAGDDDPDSDTLGDSEDAPKGKDGKPKDAKSPDDKSADKGKDGKAQDTSGDWREGVLKKLEAQLTKKAKTDDEKKAVAGTIARHKAQLARYPSLEAAAMANLFAQDKLRAGEHKEKPDADAAAEEHAAWREKQGIPKEAQAYDTPKVAGHQWTEADEPVLASFKDAAHKVDMPQAMYAAVTDWYARAVEAAKEARHTQIATLDREDRKHAREALKEELGAEYQPRLKLLDRFLEDDEIFPDGAGKALFNARDEKGRRVALNPAVTKFLMEAALNAYGEGALISGDAKSEISTRKAFIQGVMKTDMDRYRREGLDAEYQKILEAEEAAANPRGRRAA